MAGESLEEVEVTPRGLAGDRWYAVVDANGCFATAKNSRRFRKHDEVFDFGARTLADGSVEAYRHDGTDGPWPVGTVALDTELSARMGEPVRVLPEGEVPHFDDAPVSVIGTASLDWFAEHHDMRVDDRRLRANLVLATDVPFVEETWTSVRVGEVDFEVVTPITRCRVVDLAQNHLTHTMPLLRTLGATRDVKLGVYLAPRSTGVLRCGDPVHPVVD